MNWRGVLIVSVGLNILLGAVVLKSRQNRTEPAATGTPATVIFKTNILTRTITNHVEPPSIDPPTDVVWPRWNEIASENLQEYHAALERYGCPAGTMRDILKAELSRRFYIERQALLEPVSRVFWDAVARNGFDDNVTPFKELDADLRKLAGEYGKLTDELSGVMEPGRIESTQMPDPEYAHLSGDAQHRLAGLDQKFQRDRGVIDRDKQYHDEDGQMTVEGQALLKQLELDLATHRRELMSDEEFHEYRLRSSGAANWAADRPGFEPSDEEIRQVAEWKMELEEEHRPAGGMNEDDYARSLARLEIESELNPRMKELFGKERFEAYIRSSSSDYQALYDLGDRFNLPETTVNEAWEMQRTAQAAAEQIRNDTALTRDEQRDALWAVQQETYQSFETLLSEDIDQAYVRRSGDWIEQLSPINK